MGRGGNVKRPDRAGIRLVSRTPKRKVESKGRHLAFRPGEQYFDQPDWPSLNFELAAVSAVKPAAFGGSERTVGPRMVKRGKSNGRRQV